MLRNKPTSTRQKGGKRPGWRGQSKCKKILRKAFSNWKIGHQGYNKGSWSFLGKQLGLNKNSHKLRIQETH